MRRGRAVGRDTRGQGIQFRAEAREKLRLRRIALGIRQHARRMIGIQLALVVAKHGSRGGLVARRHGAGMPPQQGEDQYCQRPGGQRQS